MRKKVSKTRKATRKPTRKTKKTRRAPARKTAKIKRIRRSTKATQVTGAEIDAAYDNLLNRTPLERQIDAQAAENEDEYSNTLLAVHYEEHDPFDPDDEDLDEEPENRKRMYEVPPKARSPNNQTR